MFERVMPFQRTLLLAMALKDRRIQIERVTLGAPGQALHLPLSQRFEQAL
jgi:hypothetical protein